MHNQQHFRCDLNYVRSLLLPITIHIPQTGMTYITDAVYFPTL